MPLARQYRQQAARQRKIARAIPLSSLRQRFLTSAERYEMLAKAQEELTQDNEPDVD
jgi:hypothetical protein